MREIKFRVWDKEDKIMSGGYDITDAFFNYKENRGSANGTAILMQFTGLKDKNGKEIYEGDVLKGLHLGKYAVAFSGGEFNCGSGARYIPKAIWHKSEVLGNIYENPELIK